MADGNYESLQPAGDVPDAPAADAPAKDAKEEKKDSKEEAKDAAKPSPAADAADGNKDDKEEKQELEGGGKSKLSDAPGGIFSFKRASKFLNSRQIEGCECKIVGD